MPKDLPFEKKELEIIVHNPDNLKTVNYKDLKILQGDLKTLNKEEKRKLHNSIKKYGYFVPAFIWRSGEDMWILDATQRYYVLSEFEANGYSIPEIPYVTIEAKDRKEAAKKLLLITSRFGKINPETSFFTDFDIELDFMEEIEIPEFNLNFSTEFDSFSDIIKEFNEESESPTHAITFLFDDVEYETVKTFIYANTQKALIEKIVSLCGGE